jgi:hypothetical protein
VVSAPQVKNAPVQAPKTSFLAGSLSIKVAPIKAPEQVKAEVKPLTQEDLERYWAEAGKELDLVNLLDKATVRLGDQPGRIEIDAQTTYFHDDFKPHKIDVIEFLRKKSSMPMLDAKVNPKFVETEEVIYSPVDKYNAMLQLNPKLSELRKMFPNIDY